MTIPPTEPQRPRRTWQEELTATGDELVGQVRRLVNEGNVRRVIVKHEGRTILELPLTIGVVGVLLAPQLAALGAVAALLTRCTITVEREEPLAAPPASPTTSTSPEDTLEQGQPPADV
ncbi:MAG: DUF4342 domain-containing protein [Chloroflexi bacterium]|nr:DUF4342 domain-containing protein [Chloroflexota bacterium]